MPKPVQASSYTFRDIITGGFLYVDKTRYLYDVIRYTKGTYFLARPRRFGKSLMISTLDEIFQGHKELFHDLWLYDSDYDWQTHPVIRLDFSQEPIATAVELQDAVTTFLEEIAHTYHLSLSRQRLPSVSGAA
jgi:hypothetical protein